MRRWFWIGCSLIGLAYAVLIIWSVASDSLTISSFLLWSLMAIAAVLLLRGLAAWIKHLHVKLYRMLRRMMK
ncbi:hypothetical protein D3P09_00575 [Paenibacillus pinisoli]|uniref:Uncharacterized protein n=1 Tax=Paenibacillus pinisoli TaxID=1276110 RepID=A0A3A6PUU4_9BACL|nr:hypothetical protein [Paenibacillus pinisoli]RJX40551.1 hypothetical protein D3P09_00575 [Paenibacillus pinisoli]